MPDPQLCVTVTGRTAGEMRAARVAAEPDADLVELRLDTMTSPDAAAAMADRRRPVIVTCRPVREGGFVTGTEEERARILLAAHAAGAEFIDVEFDSAMPAALAERRGRGVIVSRHDFGGVPGDIPRLLDDMRATGAEVVKLAVSVRRLSDMIPLLDAARPDGTAVLLAMGPAGVPSRVLAARFGSRWTYAGERVAPGQMPVSQLTGEFRFRRVRRETAVYGLLGRPILHSLSPAMHNAGFAALGLNATYVPLEAEDVRDFRAFADAIDLRGANVTIPFKRDVLAILDEVAPIAREVGAVNTITHRDGRWIGTNTDVEGFVAPLRRRGPLRDARALVLGAGGAARAAAAALRAEGAHVSIAAREPSAAEEIGTQIGAAAVPWPGAGRWDLVINATPVGSTGSPGLSADPATTQASLAYDLVYEPSVTPFLQAYADVGADVLGGLDMLVAQAERAFEIWTGQRPPSGLFLAAAEQAQATR